MRSVTLAAPETIVRIYYQGPELRNKDISDLFGGLSSATVQRLKQKALALMEERGVMRYRSSTVDRNCAFDAWGIDIKEMERCMQKQLKLGLNSNTLALFDENSSKTD